MKNKVQNFRFLWGRLYYTNLLSKIPGRKWHLCSMWDCRLPPRLYEFFAILRHAVLQTRTETSEWFNPTIPNMNDYSVESWRSPGSFQLQQTVVRTLRVEKKQGTNFFVIHFILCEISLSFFSLSPVLKLCRRDSSGLSVSFYQDRRCYISEESYVCSHRLSWKILWL